MKTTNISQDFYARVYKETTYSNETSAELHPFYSTLKNFLRKHSLENSKCLEIGSGRGAFQEVVDDYTGVDYSESVARYYNKPFFRSQAEALPFPDSSFDAAWSYAVLEHVNDPGKALDEIRRVLKPTGLLLLEPAWQCRPWAAEGYPVRPYSDFTLEGKLIKASIPVRNSLAFRLLHVIPSRSLGLLRYLLRGKRDIPLRYRRLKANFEHFWMSDSDAQCCIDPYDALLFFQSRGDECLNYPTAVRKFIIRTGPLVIRVRKAAP